jgi:hypothetical protein
MTSVHSPRLKHCYLFALEVQPLEAGATYRTLPLHCTLMHRFLSELSPGVLAGKLGSFFAGVPQVKLIPREYVLLGPNQVPVSELELTSQIRNLHMELYALLNSLRVKYTAPEWVGQGYRPHVSGRENARLEIGSEHISPAIYLIEVEEPDHAQVRIIRHTFALNI